MFGWKQKCRNSSLPIHFSKSAASLAVALGKIPGSLKLVCSKELMTKKNRMPAMIGMAKVRLRARKGQLKRKQTSFKVKPPFHFNSSVWFLLLSMFAHEANGNSMTSSHSWAKSRFHLAKICSSFRGKGPSASTTAADRIIGSST